MLCEYECGQEANYYLKFKSGNKWCCSKHYSSCPSNIKCWNKGLTKKTDRRVLKYSESKIGSKPWNKGLTKKNDRRVLEISKKISKSKTGGLSNYKRRSIKINSNVKNSNLYVGYKNNKYHSKESIKKFTKTKQGMSYDKISLIRKKYPLFCKIENPIQDKNNNIIIKCKNCDKEFIPTHYQLYARIYEVEKDDGNGGCYFYCSEKCKQECPLFNLRTDYFLIDIPKEQPYTAAEYQKFRQFVLKRENKKCENCGEKATHVHHIHPQKLEPFFSLDPDFGIACCEKCHYKYGHKDECSTYKLATKNCT